MLFLFRSYFFICLLLSVVSEQKIFMGEFQPICVYHPGKPKRYRSQQLVADSKYLKKKRGMSAIGM
jgi:hypothetical protein